MRPCTYSEQYKFSQLVYVDDILINRNNSLEL